MAEEIEKEEEKVEEKEEETEETDVESLIDDQPKRKRGRPPGSKNKPKDDADPFIDAKEFDKRVSAIEDFVKRKSGISIALPVIILIGAVIVAFVIRILRGRNGNANVNGYPVAPSGPEYPAAGTGEAGSGPSAGV